MKKTLITLILPTLITTSTQANLSNLLSDDLELNFQYCTHISEKIDINEKILTQLISQRDSYQTTPNNQSENIIEFLNTFGQIEKLKKNLNSQIKTYNNHCLNFTQIPKSTYNKYCNDKINNTFCNSWKQK